MMQLLVRLRVRVPNTAVSVGQNLLLSASYVGQYLAVPWKRHIPRLVSKSTVPFSRPRRLSAILKMNTRSKLGLLHNKTPRKPPADGECRGSRLHIEVG